MKKIKKLLSLTLVMALALSMNITSFAAEASDSVRPVSTITASIDGVTSVTVGSTAAVIEQDVNENGVTEDQIYVRANLANSTEYALQSQTVSITSTKAVSGTDISFTKSGDVYTAANVDLLNKAYDVTIGDTTVKLAAGLTDGTVGIADADPLKVSNVTLAGVSTTITGTNVENEFSGNPYYGDQPWTNVTYQIAATGNLPAGTNLACVDGTMTVGSGAIVTGCAIANGAGYIFRLNTGNPFFTVGSGASIRTYYVAATMAATMQVTYQINLSEVINDSTYYTDEVEAQCFEIIAAGAEYFGMDWDGTTDMPEQVGGTIVVPIGTNAMQPMIDFYTWAEAKDYFGDETVNSGGTYLATLDGLGEFSCGSLSGWMYTDGEYSPTCTGPNVGAASYTMTDGQTITWYMTTNYFNHF